MWWKYVIEAVIVLVLMGLSASFWSLLKAPRHLRIILSDPKELKAFLDFLNPQTVLREAETIEPVFDSYEKNIKLFKESHFGALRQSQVPLLFLSVIILIGSYFMGISYLVANTAIFFVPALLPMVSSAKNQNMTYIRTIILNLLKWNSIDPDGCSAYCQTTHSEYKTLYELLKNST